LERRSVVPTALIWRRWEDGSAIGKASLNPESEQRFGFPYYVTHRAHLHDVLHHRAVELGVSIHLNMKVERYSVDEGSVKFEDGSIINANLVIAADGKWTYLFSSEV
jgi:salicylate hydroxylase